MDEMFGGLLRFENQEKLEFFVDTTNKESAIKVIEVALNYGQQNGLFTINESYMIYKMLNKLKEE